MVLINTNMCVGVFFYDASNGISLNECIAHGRTERHRMDIALLLAVAPCFIQRCVTSPKLLASHGLWKLCGELLTFGTVFDALVYFHSFRS